MAQRIGEVGDLKTLEFPCTVCINACMYYLRLYTEEKLLGTEMLHQVLAAFTVLTAREKAIVMDHFRKCGIASIHKGRIYAKRSIRPAKRKA